MGTLPERFSFDNSRALHPGYLFIHALTFFLKPYSVFGIEICVSARERVCGGVGAVLVEFKSD